MMFPAKIFPCIVLVLSEERSIVVSQPSKAWLQMMNTAGLYSAAMNLCYYNSATVTQGCFSKISTQSTFKSVSVHFHDFSHVLFT